MVVGATPLLAASLALQVSVREPDQALAMQSGHLLHLREEFRAPLRLDAL